VSATVLYMSMSLDGFIAGPNEGPDNGLGDGGERLHAWVIPGGGGVDDVEAIRRSGGVNGQVIDEFMTTGRSSPAREPSSRPARSRPGRRSGRAVRCGRHRARRDRAPVRLRDRRQRASLRDARRHRLPLDNAIRHNQPEGWINLRTSSDELFAQLEISNSGPVFSDEQALHLTRPFSRDGEARTGGGLGLGLSIAASVAASHGGAFEVQAMELGGLRIQVTLPHEGHHQWDSTAANGSMTSPGRRRRSE
jgi:Histidine kinase-, DNA gyrase B-, and HSP90-like ATPase